MGEILSTGYDRWQNPDVVPAYGSRPTFDPLYGFPEGREKKVMKVTEAEMDSLKLPQEDRDYCAHKMLKYLDCKGSHFPLVYKCEHQLHEYHDCRYEEYVDQMKDFERERRLKERAKRIAAKA